MIVVVPHVSVTPHHGIQLIVRQTTLEWYKQSRYYFLYIRAAATAWVRAETGMAGRQHILFLVVGSSSAKGAGKTDRKHILFAGDSPDQWWQKSLAGRCSCSSSSSASQRPRRGMAR